MSIFSQLRKSRQVAKEHSAKLAEQKKKEEDTIPYKHVPTHAAADAFACAPPSWREATDRPKIMEQNRRRSAMAASGFHMNIPGIPRVGSSLSHVAYPSGQVTPVVRMPRAQSYTNIYPSAGNHNVIYSMPDAALSQPASWRGKEVSRGHGYDTPRISPTPSKGDASQEGSSSAGSSQDELEIRPSDKSSKFYTALDSATAHRLHPSHKRRTSDTSERLSHGREVKHNRDSRPPPSVRGFHNIPPEATPSPALSVTLPGTLLNSTSVSTAPNGNTSISDLYSSAQKDFARSMPGSTLPSNKTHKSTSFLPVTMPTEYPGYFSEHESPLGPQTNISKVADYSDTGVPMPPQLARERKPSMKTNVYTELERIESNVTAPYGDYDRRERDRIPGPVTQDQLVNVFPEAASFPTEDSSKGKNKRFSKSGGKLVKKSRWSFGRSPAITA